MENIQRLSELAIQLADVEEELCSSSDAHFSEETHSVFFEDQKKQALIAGGGAAIALILLFATGGSGLPGLLAGAALVFALQTLYVAYGGMQFGKENIRDQQQLQGGSDQKRNRRKALRDELMRMQQEDPSLPQHCWWNTDTDPEAEEIPIETNPDYEFAIANELSIISIDGKMYLEDYTRVPVIYTNNQMYEAVQAEKTSILYVDQDLLHESKYICYHLYFGEMEPIEEIVGRTTRVVNDKDARLKEFEEKLDRQEIFLNSIGERGLRTDWEAYHAGEMSREEYRSKTRMREWEVNEKVRKMSEEPDVEEFTEYRKVFRGLVRNTFISCARIFCVAEGENAGKTALILYPGLMSPVIDLIYRADDKNRLYSGFLTDYADQEGISVRKIDALLKVRDIIDYLFSKEIRDSLGLKERNILLPRPKNMNDRVWSYLIWKDHPRA